jgi:Uma2 family endonuclease
VLNVETKLTYADYLETSDDERYELLNGELILSPSPKEIHQYISSILHIMIGTFVRERSLGKVYYSPFDVVLSNTNVVQPDILFISNERADIITSDNVQGAPDLVVEILSPASAERDQTVKLDLYARHGVIEYWIVDPDARTIRILLRGEGVFGVVGVYGEGETLRSPTLAGFNVALDEVFQKEV